MADEMLKLETARTRRKMSLNGTEHEVLDLDEMPFELALGMEALQEDLKTVYEAVQKKATDPVKTRDVLARIRQSLSLVVPTLGDGVKDLSDMQAMRLFVYFFQRPATAAAPAPAETAA